MADSEWRIAYRLPSNVKRHCRLNLVSCTTFYVSRISSLQSLGIASDSLSNLSCLMTKLSILLVFLILLALTLGGLGLGVAYLETKTLQGTIIDNRGAPISQAALTLAGRSTFSNEQGFFEIQFPRGEWELRAFADGFQTGAQKINAADLWDQNFSAALTLDPKEWHGQVVASDSQKPIAYARVELDGQVLETNVQGEFIAFGVKNGTKLKISQPGYRTVNVTVQAAGDGNQMATIPLAPAQMRVIVVDASNQKPLPGVRVLANGSSANTDVNGVVVLMGLTQDTEISAQAPGYAKATANAANDAQVKLELQPTTLQGRILDTATQQTVPNAVLLYGNAEGAIAPALSSGPQGSFTIQDFSAVPKLYIKKPGYLLGTFDLTKGGAQDFTLTPFKAKGIHLYYGIKKEDAERILNQFKNTEMNAVVFDVKEDPGYILWDSQVPLAKRMGAYTKRTYTANDQVQTCRDYKLYCIARVTVFKDVLLAQKRPDLALHNAAGGLLYENAAYWTNPSEIEVQDYHIGLAQELAAMGFDEIQYDYIRYPGTQGILASEFGGPAYRVKTIANFLQRSSDALRSTTAFFSGDLFGLTTAIKDEQGIGQVWEEVVPPFDYVSPMMYPSTWRYATNLWGLGFGIKNCGDSYACPYEIMRYGTLKAQERTKNNWTLIRPWLQAYQMNLSDMLKQAQGSDDANSAGYLFWNNSGVYPNGLFRKVDR
jgi:hypothetical protein